MAPRSFWKGYLKLSLVTCKIAMIPARSDSDKIRFHVLNRKTGNRIESRFVDAVSGEPVPEADQVRGYQKGDDDYVMLEDSEIEAAALESSRTIDVESFVRKETIDWIWYDQPHFLIPDDKVGVEAFAVIRDAMAATGKVGISRIVLYRRERAVLLEPRGKGLVLWTLRYGDEVRDAAAYFGELKSERPEARMKSLMSKLIEERTKPWDAGMVSDPVQDRLAEIIAAKRKRQKPVRPKAERPARSGNVIDIMDALRKSLASEGKAKRR